MLKAKSTKWRSVSGLIFIYLALWFNWQWIWGVIFLLWVSPDILADTTYFMEPIKKKENPILFWTIIISWVWMCLYSFLTLFYPEWKNY